VQTRPDAAQALWQTPPGAGHSESFENDVSFHSEAKRTLSIVGKFISKQSKLVYIKEFKNRSEAK
jgi:hypothetical protein